MTALFGKAEDPKIRIGSLYDRPGASFYEPEKEANRTILITGASGAMKTQKLKDLIEQLFSCGYSLVTLDFHGDIETPHQKTIELTDGPNSEMSLRPLQITPYVIGKYGIYGAASQVVSAVESAGRKFGDVQKKFLRDAVIEVWRRYGIDESNDETWGERDIPTKEWMDVLSDMHDDAENAADRNAIKSGMARIEHLAYSSAFNGREAIGSSDIINKSMRFDLSGLTSETQLIAADIILRIICREAVARSDQYSLNQGKLSSINKYVIVDEAGMVTKAQAKKQASDRLINVIMTQMRKYGVGLIAASQSLAHFDAEVRGTAACRLIFHTSDGEEARKLSRSANISRDSITGIPDRGHAIFVKESGHCVEPVITDEGL